MTTPRPSYERAVDVRRLGLVMLVALAAAPGCQPRCASERQHAEVDGRAYRLRLGSSREDVDVLASLDRTEVDGIVWLCVPDRIDRIMVELQVPVFASRDIGSRMACGQRYRVLVGVRDDRPSLIDVAPTSAVATLPPMYWPFAPTPLEDAVAYPTLMAPTDEPVPTAWLRAEDGRGEVVGSLLSSPIGPPDGRGDRKQGFTVGVLDGASWVPVVESVKLIPTASTTVIDDGREVPLDEYDFEADECGLRTGRPTVRVAFREVPQEMTMFGLSEQPVWLFAEQIRVVDANTEGIHEEALRRLGAALGAPCAPLSGHTAGHEAASALVDALPAGARALLEVPHR